MHFSESGPDKDPLAQTKYTSQRVFTVYVEEEALERRANQVD